MPLYLDRTFLSTVLPVFALESRSISLETGMMIAVPEPPGVIAVTAISNQRARVHYR
jgi:hypothetical protein